MHFLQRSAGGRGTDGGGRAKQAEAEANGETEEALLAAWQEFEEANPLDDDGVQLRDEGMLALFLTNKPDPARGRLNGCDQA